MRYTENPSAGSEPTGRRALVLGAREGTGNIGAEVAAELAVRGWTAVGDDCAMNDGSRPPGGNLPNDETAAEFGYTKTDKGRYQWFDAPSFDYLKEYDPDALVVTLGATYKDHFADLRAGTIETIIKANLTLPLEAIRRYVGATEAKDEEAYKAFREGEPRRIILVGSYAHRHPFTNGTLYCAAKAGLNMAAQCLGWELTERNYRVQVVHPFHVQGTPMWAQVEQDVMRSKGMSFEEADAYNRKDLKMPDLLRSTEVADVIARLVDEPGALEWITGPIELNGGSR